MIEVTYFTALGPRTKRLPARRADVPFPSITEFAALACLGHASFDRPITCTYYGEGTMFSLWVGSECTPGFMAALSAQEAGGPMWTEELFARI